MKRLTILISIMAFGFGAFAQTDYTKILSDSASDPEKSKFSISFSTGLGLRTGQDLDLLSGTNKDLAKQINTGLYIQLQPTYFINKTIGVGFLANTFLTRATTTVDVLLLETGATTKGKATQNDIMFFVGPAVSGRYFYDKFYSGYSFSFGAQGYQTEGKLSVSNISSTVKIFGWNWSAGGNLELGYNINRDFTVFANANYFYNLIDKAKFTDPEGKVETRTLKDEDREDASRFGLGLGVNFRF